ncbi:patatin-like phospholipase family protein [Desulfopila sp. IMCC35008]|uniref:patatin-like phospholipase family protein n=1 Tax=Desulfopila sp. IMCC35008 TaxID=2653858 RepID=UPI0013D65117|nr:patatin-like phospholipase family protein [Desulfopila sp. IMCC35008]
MSSPKTVGLVLGCGASRGWAHIGAIEAFEEANIPIDLIAGCSVGAYVGALYASGKLGSLKEFLLRMDGKKIFSYLDVVFPRSGLLNGSKRVRELFSMHTDKRTFEDLDIPLVMVATDLERGEKVVLKSGDLVEALRATMSYPGLFSPKFIKGRWLVDGGVVDPVPVGLARAMGAGIVIAVDLNSRIVSHNTPTTTTIRGGKEQPALPEKYKMSNQLIEKMMHFYERFDESDTNRKTIGPEQIRSSSATPDIVETIMTSIGIMQERMTRINMAVDRPDILIQPRLGELKMMNFDRVEHAIEEGYIGVKEKLEDIKILLGTV